MRLKCGLKYLSPVIKFIIFVITESENVKLKKIKSGNSLLDLFKKLYFSVILIWKLDLQTPREILDIFIFSGDISVFIPFLVDILGFKNFSTEGPFGNMTSFNTLNRRFTIPSPSKFTFAI